jgi:uncharacterized protein YdiU (UPF0061 family)
MPRSALSPLTFDNRFVRELPADPSNEPGRRQVHGALYSRVQPTPVAAPRLVAWSRECAALLGLAAPDVQSPAFVAAMAGNALVPGSEPYAANYGGHQFGHWAGQLGDGRAITLGEAIGAAGQRLELQLKGAGPTPYSRSADGRAVLRSSVREFLVSEAMHHLGVPTTRALCLVATGEEVIRDMFYDGRPRAEPGAIVCRVAPSFIRFGNFELPASRGDVALLDALVRFTIRRDFPHLVADRGTIDAAILARWFAEVCERTAVMVAHWMRVGFVHGVMNTDNMSILGLTIDYGPYGWIDDFDLDWTPNTTDAQGRRYRFGHQAEIAYWNLTRLASALVPLFDAHDPLHEGLARYEAVYVATFREHAGAKLGLSGCDDDDLALLHDLYGLMRAAEMDMTIVFRALASVEPDAPSTAVFADAFYDDGKRGAHDAALAAWLASYAERVRSDALSPEARRERMRRANPRFVLRNYLAQEAIDRAEQGDCAGVDELLDVMRTPYDEQPGRERYAAKRPDWARNRAGCSMLSCSS